MKDLLMLGIGCGVLYWGLKEYEAAQNKQVVEPDNLNANGQTPAEMAAAQDMNDLSVFF